MKKNKISIVNMILCLAFVVLLSGCIDTDIKNINAKGETIVCFGDSITLGYGVEIGDDYPAVLKKITHYTVINAGIDGETSTEAIKRIDSDVLSKKPFLVIVEFGGNDFLRKIPLADTIRNIEEIIKQLQSKGIMVALADISTGIIMGEYGKEFKKLSKKYGTIYIKGLLSGIITNPSLKSDFIHPNIEGYKIVAQRVYRTILPYLNKNSISRRF